MLKTGVVFGMGLHVHKHTHTHILLFNKAMEEGEEREKSQGKRSRVG